MHALHSDQYYDRYNEICLHGTIIATKFLFLGESVRDVVDLKLSSKYFAPTNILGKILEDLKFQWNEGKFVF